MKFHRLINLLAFTAFIACKTVPRDDVTSSVSEVSIRIPADYQSWDAQATFTKTDNPSDSRLVKGKDLHIKLPSGTYTINLVIFSGEGTENYQSCDTSKPYVFSLPKENAIMDICKIIDRSIVFQTLPIGPIVGGPMPPVVVNPPEPPSPVLSTPPIEPVVRSPENSLAKVPAYTVSDNCFGLPLVTSIENSEIILKLDGTINNKLIDITSYLRCVVTIKIDKAVGKIFSPLTYKLNYEGEPSFYSKNFWLMAEGQDESNKPSLPCEGFVFNSAANSKKLFICSLYDSSPEHLLEVPARNKELLKNSCLTKSSILKLNLILAGPNKSIVNNLKISEVRIRMPRTEACPDI